MPSEGGGSAPILLRLERLLFLAVKQLGSEAAKRDLEAKRQRCGDAKSVSEAARQLGSEDAKHDLDARQSSSLQGRELERGVESNKADLEAKSVSEAAKQLRSEAAKCNILLSPLEEEKKFLSELCELRNFGEGYKKLKTQIAQQSTRLYMLVTRKENYFI